MGGGHRGPRSPDGRKEQASHFCRLGRQRDRPGARGHCTGQSSGKVSSRARPARLKIQRREGTVPLWRHSSTRLHGISWRNCSDGRASPHRRPKRKRPRNPPRLQPSRGRAGARPRAATGGKAQSSEDCRAPLSLGKRGFVESISPSQVARYLNEAELQPHRTRYWLNAKEKDPQQFQEKVETVCTTYFEAPRLYQKEHTHTICTDEMTGIQALERIAPTMPMQAGCVERREFEYERHGTLTLIGNFHVVTGELVTPTLGPTRTEKDFVRRIAQTVATDPMASWVFVTDNLNIHCSESLVNWVAKQCGIEQDLGKKGRKGVLKSVKRRSAFLADKNNRIRFVFLPKHTSWLNQIEIVFGVIMRKVIRRGNFTSVADLKEKLTQFIEYFNQVFAKPFRWTFTGRPLQA